MKNFTLQSSFIVTIISFAIAGLLLTIPLQANAEVECTVSVSSDGVSQEAPVSGVIFDSKTACEEDSRARNPDKQVICVCSAIQADIDSSSVSAPTMSDFQPLGNTSVQKIMGKLINYILGFSGMVALVMFVYGGFTWMVSGGSEEKIKKAKQTFTWAVIGLIAIFASYQLVETILGSLGQ